MAARGLGSVARDVEAKRDTLQGARRSVEEIADAGVAVTFKRFFRKALEHHGRPDRVVIDGSQTNREAIVSWDTTNRLQNRSRHRLKPIRIRQSQYLTDCFEQDHRRIKRRVWPMLGFKSFASATATLAGVEMKHMMRKRQARYLTIRIRRLLNSLKSSLQREALATPQSLCRDENLQRNRRISSACIHRPLPGSTPAR